LYPKSVFKVIFPALDKRVLPPLDAPITTEAARMFSNSGWAGFLIRRLKLPSSPVAVAVTPPAVVGLAIVTLGGVVYPVPTAVMRILFTVKVLDVEAVTPPPPLKVTVGLVV
jgi:hypothetical protein